jgi:hypothetical protein
MASKKKIKTEIKLQGEGMRLIDNMSLPDIRSTYFVGCTIENMHSVIAQYSLNSNVPQNIQNHFDTARNLFLYAYHVYRFYNVAQHQLYSLLELAIRTCVGEKELDNYFKKRRSAGIKCTKGLSLYLRYLGEYKLIRNEDFLRWHHRHEQARQDKYNDIVYQKMNDEDLAEYPWNEELYNSIDVGNVEWDIIDTLIKYIPAFRNEFSHGSENLSNDVLIYFEDITTIINKMYERFANHKNNLTHK